MKYKLVLCGTGFFQEMELQEDDNLRLIGTSKGCNIRFDKDRIGEDFQIKIVRDQDSWRLLADSGVIFLFNDKETKDIVVNPGDKIRVHSLTDKTELFSMDYFIDYGLKNIDYDLKISLSQDNTIKIGEKNCDIIISDSNLQDKCLILTKSDNNLQMDSSLVRNMVTINGSPVRNDKSLVKNGSFFSILGYQFYLYNNELFTTSDGTVTTRLSNSKITYQKNHFEYPQYIKNVRQQYVIPEEEIEVLDPKASKEHEPANIVMSLIPTLMSTGVMMLMRSMIGSGKRMIFMSAGMMIAGVSTTIISFVSNAKKRKKDEAKREKDYFDYLKDREEYIISIREKEYELSCQKNPSLDEEIKFVADFDSRLFSRKKEHDDFLLVRIGTGIVKTKNPVKYNTHDYVDTEDYLMDYPKSIKYKYEYIQDMPVLLDLKNSSAIGFVGSRTKLYQMVKNLALSIAIEHFYQDVQLMFIMNEDEKRLFDWARWFHNTTSPSGILRNFMYDDDSSKILLEYIYAELSRRDEMKEEEISNLPHFVIFAYRSERITSHPLKKYYDRAAKLGFTFLFFEEYEEFVNDSCTKLIFLSNEGNTGLIRNVENGEIIQEFEYEHIPGDIAARAALKLGCVYVDEASLAGSLTKNISLFELLGIMNINDLELEKRWNASRIYESMAAPLGVKTGNEIVYLDLHEKFHGPHGLVAGTTGSGKSEIMQTYICSMATLFHPYEVGFIIIDFKGGGMVNQFRDLPHLNGAITNIDGREIDRSLMSIKAELLKRQELFAQAGVNKIDDYIKLFKKGEVKTALPHLILIVDEFAELKSDQPEFMKELISAARIGRSLGVHLILATQKPSGVVNDQIWSNSKFKLCLKVQNKEDSNEVLKSPLAAEIREPGRAYLQVGNNEIFQLFQSAYSGAPSQFDTLGNSRKFKLSKVSLCGRREVFFEQKPKSVDDSITQLDAVVQYVKDYCMQNGIERLPNICLPSLSDYIPIPEDVECGRNNGIYIPVGFYDDPSRQSQKHYYIDFSQGNIFILGSSQFGKTTFIQTMIKQIATNYSPSEVCIYILDFASMFLKNFSKLKHVGGVITASDDDKIKKFFNMMEENLASRKETFAKLGVTSYSSYREAGFNELPQIVIFLENLTAFREIYPNLDDYFITLCRDGLSLGITVVITNSQTSGMGFRYLSNFATRIVFTCNNSSDYNAIFDRCKLTPAEVPGRAVIEINKTFYECQMYVPFEAQKEFEKIELMRSFINETNEKYSKFKNSGIIPEVPDVVTKEFVLALDDNFGEYDIPIGITYADVSPQKISMDKVSKMVISGKEEIGKNEFITYLVGSIINKCCENRMKLFFVDKVNREFEETLKDKENVAYSCNVDDIKTYLSDISAELKNRYDKMAEGDLTFIENEPLIVLIANTKEAQNAIDADRAIATIYNDIINKYKNLKVFVIFSDFENVSTSFSVSSAVIKSLKEDRYLVVFDSVAEQKVIEMSLQFAKANSKKPIFGDAFVSEGADIFRVKTILNEK